MTAPNSSTGVRWGTAAGRWILMATVLGSALTFLDMSVISVALPHIGRDLDASTAGLQWTVNGYSLTLASLILLCGALGDRFGRRRVFLIGAAWFTLASLACALAPTTSLLVVARILQGVGGALLTPGSLALIQSSFHPDDRARAIGLWAGLSSMAGVVGPFVGGWILEVASWRWIFLLNLPLGAVVIAVAARRVPESADLTVPRRLDLAGAALGVLGLAGITFGLTAWPDQGPTAPAVLAPVVMGAAALAAFVLVESRSRHAMLPMKLFRSRPFTATQAETLALYAALSGGIFFFVPVTLQVVSGYSPLAAGLATVPTTLLLLAFGSRAGALGARIGPRIPMAIGPLVAAVGYVLLAWIGPDAPYVSAVLPGVLLVGVGVVLFVAPLTATALAAAPDRHAGVASGVNNAVARAAGLLAVAALPLVARAGPDLNDAAALGPAHHTAMLVCAGLLVAGGVIGLVFIPSSAAEVRDSAAERTPG